MIRCSMIKVVHSITTGGRAGFLMSRCPLDTSLISLCRVRMGVNLNFLPPVPNDLLSFLIGQTAARFVFDARFLRALAMGCDSRWAG